MATAIPGYLIDFFLRGQTRRAAFEQFMKDGGVTTDVWLAFAQDRERPLRVLVAPVDGFNPAELGYALHRSILRYRAVLADKAEKEGRAFAEQERPSISPMEDYVVARVYFDELLHVLLPLTDFFYRNRFDELAGDAGHGLKSRTEQLEREIRRRLGETGLDHDHPGETPLKPADRPRDEKVPPEELLALQIDHQRRRGIIAAAPVAALIGLITGWDALAKEWDGEKLDRLSPADPETRSLCNRWATGAAGAIARSAVETLTAKTTLREEDLKCPAGGAHRPARDQDGRWIPMIQRIFIDRQARLSHKEAICAVKADAAQLLFEITCKDVTWAIIDSGIAALHPAFIDHDALRLRPADPPNSRVRKTYDFTMIGEIRNFDLIDADDAMIKQLVERLAALPVARKGKDRFRKVAAEALQHIAGQLRLGLRPDWRLIEPLIELEPDHGASLTSDHGTHVAGTLGGDWREEDGARHLAGMCPDINLYDMRVIPYPGHVPPSQDEQLFATESAVLAALEFIQFLNSRTMVRTQIIHGVNVSMSIPHDVRNYGCGATPICVACDRLVGSGVVVVAAAGNRGWNE